MNQCNDNNERHGYWEVHWDSVLTRLSKENPPRYIWRGQYENGKPINLFQYYTYVRKLHRKEFHL
jgi:hypothetical protein